jgi:hypothetical protein
MRVQRVIIVPVILAFSLAGSILASPAIATAATHGPNLHATTTTSSFVSNTLYHA